MAFPTSLTNAVDGSTDVVAALLNNLEAKVGIDSSAVTTSHDYKLSGVTGSYKAVSTAAIDTDGTMAANSDTVVPSQKATRTYISTLAKNVCIMVVDGADSVTTGDGKAYFTIPSDMNGMNLVAVHARVITAGTTNTTDVQLRNVTDSVDMLSTKLTVDSAETGSDTAATPAVIDTTKDDVATNDLIAIDIDAASTTAPKGLVVRLRFVLP